MTMQVSCRVKGQPFVLQNPIMPGPGSFGNVAEYREIVDLSRLGALVPNSLMPTGGGPNGINKFCQTPYGFLSSFGPNNISLQAFIDDALPLLPADTPVFVDLKATSMEEMQRLAALAGRTDRTTAIEVNLNCPYGTGESPYWTDPDRLSRLMHMVVDAAQGKMVIAAAPSGHFSMEEMAQVLEEAGTDLFVSFNNIEGCAIDIRSRTVQGGGYFGPGIKPYGLYRCREAAQCFRIPVIGGGGITTAADVIEYIMAGAFAVKVGSANLTRPDFMIRLLEELELLMKSLDIASMDEIRGCAKPIALDLF